MKKIIILFYLTISCISLFPQSGELQIGSNPSKNFQSQGSLYDYSDPEGVNIKVAVWGYVRNPGKYIIPAYSTVNDLLSYAGGPLQDANVDDLRLYRSDKDSVQILMKFNYNELFWNKDVDATKIVKAPDLLAGDILVVPGEPRLFFRDYLGLGLSVVSTLISLAILILNIANN